MFGEVVLWLFIRGMFLGVAVAYLFSMSMLSFDEFKAHLWRDEGLKATVAGPFCGLSTTMLSLVLARILSRRCLMFICFGLTAASAIAAFKCHKRKSLLTSSPLLSVGRPFSE
eukprot:Gregarina_sp_Poly_1__8196@NODE_475_length_8096_cov_496_560966_g384_i0_p8_GENE_NODE_475_length_8096_cov_496_560966_g384_i0NODE_475_length_8096_cov_496_560966_g384_i0_p8_ORF_typecomplete_len113_score12_93MFS_1/PF07690_16/1_2DUF2407_C/PF13373_6/3_1e02DUF2407_C/PF13373_6/1_6_NODE_475_length_8096_cov_496_560966_g384_i032293567